MPMIFINEAVYREMAALLSRRLERQSFFNGRIEYDTEEFSSELICTLILESDPGTGALRSAVPVWWEYRLRDASGEVPTDFCWSELHRFLVTSA